MKILAVTIFSFLLLVACGPSPEQQAAMTATAMTATAAAWTPTPTATNTPTSTPTPTPTNTPTPTLTPTVTNTPTPTRDPNRYVASDDSFSMMTPEGWETQDTGMNYISLVKFSATGDNGTIVFSNEKLPLSVLDYSSILQSSMKGLYPDLTVISEDSMLTSSGLEYVRLVIEYSISEIPVHQVICIFDNDGSKIMVVYSRPNMAESEDDPAVIEAIDTFRFGP